MRQQRRWLQCQQQQRLQCQQQRDSSSGTAPGQTVLELLEVKMVLLVARFYRLLDMFEVSCNVMLLTRHLNQPPQLMSTRPISCR